MLQECLEKFQYLGSQSPDVDSQSLITLESYQQAIQNFQAYVGVNVTGIIFYAIVSSTLHAIACGMYYVMCNGITWLHVCVT